MTTVNRQHLILPYGVSHWDKKAFSATPADANTLNLDCHTRYIIIDPTEAAPLRLNGGQYEFQEPPNMRLLPTVFDQLAFIETHLFTLCGTWSKFQRLFITRYFGFIVQRVEKEREQLSKAIEAFGNLYEYLDWAFSAFRPLPQAYVYAPKDKAPNTVPSAVPEADDFVPVDMMFWTGQNILALDLSDPDTADPFQTRRLERVKQAGIDILAITPTVLEDKNDNTFRDALPESMQNFWQGELAPSRPFVDTKLSDIAPSDIGF